MPGSGYRKGKQCKQRRSCTLKDLEPGTCARIHCHHATGPIRHRLLALGLIPQSEVNVIQRAPLGDPIVCRVDSCRVTLRNSEAALIEVEVD